MKVFTVVLQSFKMDRGCQIFVPLFPDGGAFEGLPGSAFPDAVPEFPALASDAPVHEDVLLAAGSGACELCRVRFPWNGGYIMG